MIKTAQEPIKVMVRIKPPPSYFVYKDQHNPNVLHCSQKSYNLDHLFPAETTNQDVFQRVGTSIIQNTLAGYNSTLFVYGPTGTGKTHTMSGKHDDVGIVQRCIHLLMEKLNNQLSIENYSLKVSYVEIYNEKVKDLLTQKICQVREQVREGFYVQGLKEVFIRTDNDFEDVYRKGNIVRATKTTSMNSSSSRSHSILTVSVETKQNISGDIIIKYSKINFVDLAGSEKLKQTGATGQRKTEAASINLSLQALRKVIATLQQRVSSSRTPQFVPYRGSVLTELLKDSLGGSAHTTIIGTINAKNENIKETMMTLTFLEGAKRVKNVKKVNLKLDGNEQKLKAKINQLEEKVSQLQNSLEIANKQIEKDKVAKETYQNQIAELQQKILELNQPRSWLDNLDNMNNYDFMILQDQKQLSFDGGMSIISQNLTEQSEYNNKAKSLKTILTKSKFNTQQLPSKKRLDIDNKFQIDHLYQQQIHYLTEKNQRLIQGDKKYENFLKNIEQNIDRFNLEEAQVSIFQLQQQQLEQIRFQLNLSEETHSSILKQYAKQKQKFKTIVTGERKIMIDNITKTSQLQSQQSQRMKNIEQLERQIQKCQEIINKNADQFNIVLMKLQQERDQERKQKIDLLEILQDKNARLQEMTIQLELKQEQFNKRFRQAQKQICAQKEKQINTLRRENEILSASELQNNRSNFQEQLRSNVQQLRLAQDKMGELLTDIDCLTNKNNHLNQQLQDKHEEIIVLIDKIETLEKQIAKLEEMLHQKDLQINNSQQKIENLKEQLDSMRINLIEQQIIQIENRCMSVNNLINDYKRISDCYEHLREKSNFDNNHISNLLKQIEQSKQKANSLECLFEASQKVYSQIIQEKDQMIKIQTTVINDRQKDISLLIDKLEQLCLYIRQQEGGSYNIEKTIDSQNQFQSLNMHYQEEIADLRVRESQYLQKLHTYETESERDKTIKERLYEEIRQLKRNHFTALENIKKLQEQQLIKKQQNSILKMKLVNIKSMLSRQFQKYYNYLQVENKSLREQNKSTQRQILTVYNQLREAKQSTNKMAKDLQKYKKKWH